MRHNVNVGQRGDRVLLFLNGVLLFDAGWRSAEELCRALSTQIRDAEVCEASPEQHSVGETKVGFDSSEFAFRTELGKIIWIGNGRFLFDTPVRVAQAIWTALVAKTRLAEEQAKAEQIAKDAALLIRTGAPFGLTDNAQIQDEAVKIARDDRDLRRFLPGGIKSTEILGTPRVFHGRRSNTEKLITLAPDMTVEQRAKLARALSN